jgi:hypothetical protein
MKKSLAFLLATLSILIVLSSSLTSSLATDYTIVGVKAGDKAEYTFASSDSRMNGAVAHVSIQKVEGSKVTINGTIRYPNGTIQGESIGGDISSGQNSSYYFLVCANLTQGDPIFNGSDMKVTETTSMSVLGATREVNHMSLNYLVYSFDIYWDKLSGLMVRLVGGGMGQWIGVTMTNTTVWSPISQPPGGSNNTGGTGSGSNSSNVMKWLIAGGVAAAAIVVIAVAVLLRRRRE